jgi:hypothetical protein
VNRRVLVAAITLGLLGVPAVAHPSVGQDWHGYWAEAAFECNPYDDKMLIHASAGAAPGYQSQSIWYKHYLWRYGTGWITLTPPAEGWIQHSREPVVSWEMTIPVLIEPLEYADGTEWTLTPGPGGIYAIYTEYWWWNGQTYDGPLGTWSNWVHYQYQNATINSPWCDFDAELKVPDYQCPWCTFNGQRRTPEAVPIAERTSAPNSAARPGGS